MADFPQAGKIQQSFFSEVIFPKCGKVRPEVLIGPRYGVDISVVKLPDGMAMVLTSDPLTLIPSLGLKESAWLSVHILANDMATTGFAPMYAQFVLNLPTSITVAEFRNYWNYIHQYCEAIGIAITGGHTGQVVDQNSTIAGGDTMITIAPEAATLTSNKAKAGDAIIVTKECALSATAVLAMSFSNTVKNRAGKEIYSMACELFNKTSCLKDALVAVAAPENNHGVSAMHDVTEGGVLGAIYEIATASDCGVKIYNERIPVGYAQQAVCTIFQIDPRYVVGTGAMIIAVSDNAKKNVLQRLQYNNIEAAEVGYFTKKEEGKILIEDGISKHLSHPGTDAYWNAFYTAFNKGWK